MAASKAHIEATARFESKAYDKLVFNVRKDSKQNLDFIRAHAEIMGESVNGFLVRSISEAVERDKLKGGDPQDG
ncbi:MAG: hypothetical protein OSJ43_12435 [Oscillospiraceae bacterium]|nr:hypothetical protein [Oscillospiraceae bacterium]